jgi:NADH-quinone oxidoreductase subunit N
MTVLLIAALAIPGGMAALLARRRPRVSLVIGGVAALVAVALAGSIGADDGVLIAGTVVSGSDGLRTIGLAWAAGIVLLGVADAFVGGGGAIVGPSLIGFGTGVLALAVADAGVGFALLTAGAIGGAIGSLAWLGDRPSDAAAVGLRVLRPVALAGLLALGAVAWGASAAGPFSAGGPPGAVDPALDVAIGLAFLAVVAAVVLRMAAIPVHAWGARFAEAAPAGAIPTTLGWGAAGFALVALGWVDVTIGSAGAPLGTERTVVAIVAAASILLGGVAAVLHDDLEHVLGYSIVQDAGVALLAFAAVGPEAEAAGRDWIVGLVAVKTGLAAWVLVTRAAFGVRRLSELGGWARSSPILGLALVLVIVGAVGLPGMATFTARGVLTDLALPAPFDVIVLLGAFAPVVYLGRILVIGVDRMSDAARAGQRMRPRLRDLRPDGWTSASTLTLVRAAPGALRENRFALAAGSAVLVALIGLAVATGGLTAATPDEPAAAAAHPGGPASRAGAGS